MHTAPPPVPDVPSSQSMFDVGSFHRLMTSTMPRSSERPIISRPPDEAKVPEPEYGLSSVVQ